MAADPAGLCPRIYATVYTTGRVGTGRNLAGQQLSCMWQRIVEGDVARDVCGGQSRRDVEYAAFIAPPHASAPALILAFFRKP